jgi:hypothetical protein
MIYTSQTPKRQCLNCVELLSGRSDKKFCSNSCKAQHHRATSLATAVSSLPPLSAPIPALAEALLACVPYRVLNAYYREGGCPEEGERYRRVAASQASSDPLYSEYAGMIQQLLYCQFDDIRNVGYPGAVQELSEAINAYLQHPGLHIPGHLAHHRLADLYMLHSLFHSLHRQAIASEARGPYPRGQEPEMPNNYDYLSKRQLKQLWANLLGVA